MNTKSKFLRPATENEKDVFNWLNAVRDSGAINMFGVAPYIMEEFGTSRRESIKLFNLWRANFDPDGNYDIITDKDEE